MRRFRIVLATANPHKVAEMRALFATLPFEVLGLDEVAGGGTLREPEESGSTFEANAVIKAAGYAAQVGLPCLADDSGLEVDALGGAPGVISSHYGTGGRETGLSREERDAQNNRHLLANLAETPFEARTARFVCVMVLADRPHGDSAAEILASARGSFEGRIGIPGDHRFPVPRGSNGFGYDPLFLVAPHYSRTAAELAPAEKNAVSHRARAAAAMATHLRRLAGAL